MSIPIDYPWIEKANLCKGYANIPEPKVPARFKEWIKNHYWQWLREDRPLCCRFVAYCVQQAEITIPLQWWRVSEWINWGVKLSAPTMGCIAVFQYHGTRHLGFIVGRYSSGVLAILSCAELEDTK